MRFLLLLFCGRCCSLLLLVLLVFLLLFRGSQSAKTMLTVCVTSEVAKVRCRLCTDHIPMDYMRSSDISVCLVLLLLLFVNCVRWLIFYFCLFSSFFFSSLCLFVLQLFNIIHLTAGACLVHDDPDKTQTLFEFN